MAELNGDPAQREPGARVEHTSSTAGTLLLSIAGEIDLLSGPPLREAIDRIIVAEDPRALIIDVGAVGFIDSSGLALLLTLARQVEHLELRNPSATLRKVIDVTGLTAILPITP